MYSSRQSIPITLKEKYLQCPWSYKTEEHDNIKKGIIPNKFTKIFIEKIKKGDKIVILYKGLKKALYIRPIDGHRRNYL